MAIPTPSFFRIRLMLLIVCFVVFFFLVGVVKNAFGVTYTYEESPCKKTFYKIITTGDGGPGGMDMAYSWTLGEDGLLALEGYGEYTYSYIMLTVGHYYWTGSNWLAKSMLQNQIFKQVGPGESYTEQYAPLGTCTDCSEAKEAKRTECGGDDNVDWSSWNDQTCVGVCKPPCPATGTAQKTWVSIVGRLNTEICLDDCAWNAAGISLYNFGENKTYYSLLTSKGERCAPGLPSDTGEEPEVEYKTTKILPMNKSTPVPDVPEEHDPVEKPADAPTNPDNPNDADLKAIKEGLDGAIQNGNDINQELNDQTAKLDWIGKNSAATAENTKAIGEFLQDGGLGDGIGDAIQDGLSGLGEGLEGIGNAIDGMGDELGEVGDTLDEINDGTYVSPTEEEEYEVPEHDFAERTSEFLAEMKTTGLFSLPNMLANSIPSGGSSTLEINTGVTFGGIHTIDFNYLSGGLSILKYIFQIAGMALAIRIVTLKR